MSNDNYKDLLGDILDNMISINEQISNNSNDGNNDYHERINERASDRGPKTKKRTAHQYLIFLILAMTKMLPCMNCTCQTELNSFEDRNVTVPFRNASGDFHDPLSWWKSQGALRFPHLAKLAKTYLYIPATSAPSERVWSRASNILTIRRARMSDTAAERIMFTKEKSRILRKHYTAMTGSKYVPHLPSVYEDSIVQCNVRFGGGSVRQRRWPGP